MQQVLNATTDRSAIDSHFYTISHARALHLKTLILFEKNKRYIKDE